MSIVWFEWDWQGYFGCCHSYQGWLFATKRLQQLRSLLSLLQDYLDASQHDWLLQACHSCGGSKQQPSHLGQDSWFHERHHVQAFFYEVWSMYLFMMKKDWMTKIWLYRTLLMVKPFSLKSILLSTRRLKLDSVTWSFKLNVDHSPHLLLFPFLLLTGPFIRVAMCV